MKLQNWKKYNGALIPDHPPHIEIAIDSILIKQKIKEERAFFARWTTNFDCKEKTEFWHVICDQFIPIEMLSRNTRSKRK